MVKLIAGKKGSGKSKEMIKLANNELLNNSGNIVFLDDDDRNIFDLNHDIRFIDISEYNVKTKESFLGFITGMISKDYDMDTVFVDGLLKMVNIDGKEITDLVNNIETLSDKHNIKFYLAISHPITELPSDLEKFLY